MKAIVNRGRRILSNIFRAISVFAASLILHACYNSVPRDDPGWGAYGMPPPDPDYVPYTSINGKVQSKETKEPIFGLQVTIVSIDGTEYLKRTDEEGWFSIYLPVQEIYILKIEDVDGPYNGGLFKEQTWTLNQNESYYTLLLQMDLDVPTDAE